MDRRVRHPSERPIRRDAVVKRGGFTRVPYDQPLTPGLRRSSSTQAIGFLARLSEETED